MDSSGASQSLDPSRSPRAAGHVEVEVPSSLATGRGSIGADLGSSTVTTESRAICEESPADPTNSNDPSMAREPTLSSHSSTRSSSGAAAESLEKRKMQQNNNEIASPNDTEVDDDDEGDNYVDNDYMDSDGELGTPLGVGGPAGFGDFEEEDYASHRFMGPSVVGDDRSTRALHGLRRVMVHAKPPKFASELSAVRPSFSSSSSFRRSSSTATTDTITDSLRSYSLDPHQALNAYQVTFSESKSTGFSTRLSISEDTAELAVRVAAVVRDSPAFKAGVVVGDTLLSINDHPIEGHMTENQVDELLVSQRGSRTIVFARNCVDSPGSHRDQSYSNPRSHSQGNSGSMSSDTASESVMKKPGKNGRFSKAKLSSALSYGGSLMASKLKRKKSVVHKGVSCDGCGVDSITGALWSCSVCPDYNLCSDCYEVGTHGMENTDAMQTLNEALVQFRLQKRCKHFTPEFLLSLRRDICKGRPDKFEYMGGWIADIVNGTAASKITVRGIEIPHLPATSRQRFVGKLMPLVSNRRDIEVNIEWLPDDSDRPSIEKEDASGGRPSEELEKLRIWISDKKGRTASPFA